MRHGGDADAATRTREEMRRAGVPADDVTFAALFDACAGAGKRLRGIQRVPEDEVEAFDDASWDDWDDWGSPAATSVSSSRAALAGALAESEKDKREKGKASDASGSSGSSGSGSSSSSSSSSRMVPSLGGGPVSAFGEAAKAAAKAAREGLSSASALMEGGASTGLASGEEGALRSSSLWDPAGGGGRSVYGGGPAAETARAIKALAEFRRDAERSAEKSSSTGTHPFSTPRVVTSIVGAYGALGEFDDMMATLRNPPGGMGADAHAYTQALHSLALGGPPAAGNDDAGAGKKTNPAARGGEGGAKRVASGPAAALALADEMEHALGIRPTRVTLACCLLACAKMRDFSRAKARFDAHAEKGYEIGADSFDGLFKAAHAGGAFARVAGPPRTRWSARASRRTRTSRRRSEGRGAWATARSERSPTRS